MLEKAILSGGFDRQPRDAPHHPSRDRRQKWLNSVVGLFAQWQPQYAELGLATFPVREKKPAVRGYLKIGTAVSEQLASKFANDDAFGLACRPGGICVLDVDTSDERVFADALSEFGATPFHVRSGSGNWQAWYRNTGQEGRRVRPDPTRPIDVLGNGFVVAPPSRVAKGCYEIVSGSLDVLTNLPPMREAALQPRNNSLHNRLTPSSFSFLSSSSAARIENGSRNKELWRACMLVARRVPDINELVRKAYELNETMFYEPLPSEEVLSIVTSAWARELKDENWVGGDPRATMYLEEMLHIHSAHALRLLALLRQSHSWRLEPFAIDQAEVAKILLVHRQQMTGIIKQLLDAGLLRRVHCGRGKGDPHLYHLKRPTTVARHGRKDLNCQTEEKNQSQPLNRGL